MKLDFHMVFGEIEMTSLIDEIKDFRLDEIIGPVEAAEFLQISEDAFMNAVLKGYLPGGCIDGQWRFSKWGLKKFCLQRNNHALGSPWMEKVNPHFFGDFGKNKTQEVIDAYEQGQRYFPILNIEGGRFTGLDMTGIDFWDCSLQGANFTNAILKSASFVATDLRSAIFEGADLTDADFRCAFVKDANFRGAKLNRTILKVRSMSGADLSGANISSAQF